MSPQPWVEVKRYLGLQADAVADLRIFPRELIWISGENGSGKSTFLSWLGRSLTSLQSVQQEGELVTSELEPHETALLPQGENMTFALPLTLRDVLCMSPYDLKSSSLAKTILNGLDLSLSWNSASGGERKKILLTLIAGQRDKKLFLLDEPSNHLDPQSKVFFGQWLVETVNSGTTAVFVTHENPKNFGIPDEAITQRISFGNSEVSP